MNNEKKTKKKIKKLKLYLERYLVNSDEVSILEGLDICEDWIQFLENKNKDKETLSEIKMKVNKLDCEIHALEEIKYEFRKWLDKEIA